MGKLTDTPAEIAEVQAAVEKGSGEQPSPVSKAKKPNFTPKEKKFLKGMVEEVIPGKKTKRQLAMEVYNQSPAVASVTAHENLSKPKFKDALAQAFEDAEITPGYMAEILQQAMGATKTATLMGAVIPSDEPDHSVRVSAVKAAASLIAGNDDDGKGGTTFNFNLNSGTQNFIKRSE